MDCSISNTSSSREFDTNYQSTSQLCYFYHTVDPVKATLRSDVLGPNLTFTFTHTPRTRTGETFRRSHVHLGLLKKTTGFLALVTPGNPGKRTVLAWAESGHGMNINGDMLDPQRGALPNNVWTRRMIRLAASLGINMGHPYDRLTAGGSKGIFRGSHVEVKLATHAIYVLLRYFNITHSRKRNTGISLLQLRKLKRARWDDGSRPAFEIYFSKKNCRPCATFVKKLEEATGVTIRLLWKQRLSKIDYGNTSIKSKPVNPANGITVLDDDHHEDMEVDEDQGPQLDIRDVIELDSDSETADGNDDGSDDVQSIRMVDLTGTPEQEQEPEHDASVSTPERTATASSHVLDSYIDGLAYCVGQMDTSPQDARAAIIALARTLLRRRRNKHTSLSSTSSAYSSSWSTPRRRQREQYNISKPLPATPETQPPTWLATPTPSRRRDEPEADEEWDRDGSPFLLRRSLETGRRSPRRYGFSSGERMSLNG